MNIVINEKIVKHNTNIGRFTSLGALIVLGFGLYASYAWPDSVALSFGSLILGFLLSQFGIYFGNRWGRIPRVDERISSSLKGLTRDYTLYHYVTPVSHLLVGPAGVWIIEPYYQRGTIVYEKDRWRQTGGGIVMQYLKIFAQEGIGRPDLELEADTAILKKHFLKEFNENEIPEINAVLIFTDERADLQTENAPITTLKIEKLKDFIRSKAKEKSLDPADVSRIQATFPKEIN